jgi:hypothetical protein
MSTEDMDIIEIETNNTTGQVARIDRGYQASPLALLTDEEFTTRLTQAGLQIERMEKLQLKIMTLDIDYGAVPGTDKKTLFQPGAQKLNQFAGFTPDYTVDRVQGDGVNEPILSYNVRCRLIDRSGAIVGEGWGAASTWEKKHRYRYNDRSCPECGKAAIFKSKHEAGYFCWAKKGGCGSEFKSGPSLAQIEAQPLMVENPDQYDLDNTCLKMANKRALVAATVNAHACSGQFAQDAAPEGQPSNEAFHPNANQGVRTSAPPQTTNRTNDTSLVSTKQVSLGYAKLAAKFKQKGAEYTDDARHEAIELILGSVGLQGTEFAVVPRNKFNAVLDQIDNY